MPKELRQGDGRVAHIDLSEFYVYHLITCPYYALSVQVKKLKGPRSPDLGNFDLTSAKPTFSGVETSSVCRTVEAADRAE